MIPIEQTRLHAHNGNCHAACLASILEIPIDEVPYPSVEELADENGWERYRERLRSEVLNPRNLTDISWSASLGETAEPSGELIPAGYAILCAESVRTGGLHAVVAKDGEIVWDPHPQRDAGLGKWHDWTVFCVLDPAKPVNQK